MIISTRYVFVMDKDIYIRELINRVARLDATTAWQQDLNPAQRAALNYLARANRFSCSPSHVAEYLGSTRGTITQTCKALVKKGYVTEQRSETDKRVVSFQLTEIGVSVTAASNFVADAVADMSETAKNNLMTSLEKLVRSLIIKNGGRAFGVCNQCKHFESRQNGGYCTLLSEGLTALDATKICHEQDAA